MAFDLNGLHLALMAAALEYADDQGVLFDDLETIIEIGESRVNVGVYFVNAPQQVVSIRKRRDAAALTDTVFRFVTMFETINYRYYASNRGLELLDRTVGHPDDPKLSQDDQLRLLKEALVAATE